MFVRAWLPLLAVSAVVSACFTYKPLQVGTAAPGTVVRVRLTGAGMDRFAGIREMSSRVVEGTVASVQGDTLALAFWSDASPAPRDVPPDTVRIPFGDISRLDRKDFSLGRTVILAVGTGVVVGGAVQALFNAAGHGGSPPSPGQGDLTIVLLSLPLH